jgi:hypothetical protein
MNKSPLQTKFQGWEDHGCSWLYYYTDLSLQCHCLERNAGIKIDMGLQVVEHLPCGYLLVRDALKAYKAIIDEDVGQIIFPLFNPSSESPLPNNVATTKL